MLNEIKKWSYIGFIFLSCSNMNFSYCKMDFINFRNIYTAKEHLLFLNKTNSDNSGEDSFKLSPDLQMPNKERLTVASSSDDDAGDMYFFIGEEIRKAYIKVYEVPKYNKCDDKETELIEFINGDTFKKLTEKEKSKSLKFRIKSILQSYIIKIAMAEDTVNVVNSILGDAGKTEKKIIGSAAFDSRFEHVWADGYENIKKTGLQEDVLQLISREKDKIKEELKFYWTDKHWNISNRMIHYCIKKITAYPSTYDFNDPIREATDYWDVITSDNGSLYTMFGGAVSNSKLKIDLLKQRKKFNAKNGQNLYTSLVSSEKLCNDAFKYAAYSAKNKKQLDKEDWEELQKLDNSYYFYNKISDKNIEKAKSVITPEVTNALGVFELCKMYFTKKQNNVAWDEKDYDDTVDCFIQKIKEKKILDNEINLRYDLGFYWKSQYWNMSKWCENFYNAYRKNTNELVIGGIEVQMYSFFKENKKLKEKYDQTWNKTKDDNENKQELRKAFLKHCVSDEYRSLSEYIDLMEVFRRREELDKTKTKIGQEWQLQEVQQEALKILRNENPYRSEIDLKYNLNNEDVKQYVIEKIAITKMLKRLENDIKKVKTNLGIATEADFKQRREHFNTYVDSIIKKPIGCELLRLILAFYLDDEANNSNRLKKLFVYAETNGTDDQSNKLNFYYTKSYIDSALQPCISFPKENLYGYIGVDVDTSSCGEISILNKKELCQDVILFHEMTHWLHSLALDFSEDIQSVEFINYFKKERISQIVCDNNGDYSIKQHYRIMLNANEWFWTSDEEFFTMFGFYSNSNLLSSDLLINDSNSGEDNRRKNIYYSPINEMAYVLSGSESKHSVRLLHKNIFSTATTTLPAFYATIIKNVFDQSLLTKIYKIAKGIKM